MKPVRAATVTVEEVKLFPVIVKVFGPAVVLIFTFPKLLRVPTERVGPIPNANLLPAMRIRTKSVIVFFIMWGFMVVKQVVSILNHRRILIQC